MLERLIAKSMEGSPFTSNASTVAKQLSGFAGVPPTSVSLATTMQEIMRLKSVKVSINAL
jgi:hypothetical protein